MNSQSLSPSSSSSDLHHDCWFCDHFSAQPSASLPVMLEGHSQDIRDLLGNRLAIKYQRTSVSVPRCPRCKSVHERGRRYGEVGIGIGFLLGLVGGIGRIFYGDLSLWKALGLFLLFTILDMLILYGLGAFVGWILPRPKGVLGRRHGVTHPAVGEMKIQGWVVSNNQDPEQ